MAATVAMAFVIDAMRKTVSGVMAAACVERARTEGALVEQALVGRGHRHDAGHVLRVDGLAQHAVDARARCRPLRPGRAGCRGANGCGSGDGHRSLQHVATGL